MKHLLWFLILLGMLCCVSQPAKAQNPNPCSQVTNTATAGQVLSAVNAGNTPPCQWVTGGGGGGSVSITAGTGISVSPDPITGTGVITNTAPGAPPAGSLGCVQLYATSSTFGCASGFFASTTSGRVDVQSGTADVSLYVLNQGTDTGSSPNAIEADVFPSADITKNMLGVSAYMSADGFAVSGAAAFWAGVQDLSGGTIGTYYAFYSEEQKLAANNYYSWFDSRGVRRVKDDSTFNSVNQAIEALYNPQFAKYTPGAVDYERIILGQWESNEAYVTTEAGGTGTLRRLALGGAGLDVLMGDVANPFVNQKTTVSASAPGAGKADLRWLAGTNSGTCKLVSNAGTSATEVTIIDNVGGGC